VTRNEKSLKYWLNM